MCAASFIERTKNIREQIRQIEKTKFKKKMGDYNYYDNYENFDGSVYDRTQNLLDREFSPRGEPFDFATSLAAYLNFKLLNDRLMDREPTIFDKLVNGDRK